MPEHPAGLIYGTITVAALLAAESARQESYPRTVGAVAITLLLYWLAHSYAEFTGHRMKESKRFTYSGLWLTATRELTVLLGARPVRRAARLLGARRLPDRGRRRRDLDLGRNRRRGRGGDRRARRADRPRPAAPDRRGGGPRSPRDRVARASALAPCRSPSVPCRAVPCPAVPDSPPAGMHNVTNPIRASDIGEKCTPQAHLRENYVLALPTLAKNACHRRI